MLRPGHVPQGLFAHDSLTGITRSTYPTAVSAPEVVFKRSWSGRDATTAHSFGTARSTAALGRMLVSMLAAVLLFGSRELPAQQYVTVDIDVAEPLFPTPGGVAIPGQVPVTPIVASRSDGQGVDLTGLWQDDTGGGAVYRVRQVGTRFYWIVDGTTKGSYVNAAFGEINGNVMTGRWVDLPGSPTLGGGELTLRIESNNRLVKISSSTYYGAQAWTRQGSTVGDVTPPARTGRLLIVRLNGRHAVVDWSNAPTTSGSWVSIVPVGTPDGAHASRWAYTDNKASGSFRNGPLDAGAYEARFYADGGYGQLVDRVRFDVGEGPNVTVGVQGQVLSVQVDGRAHTVVAWSNAPTPQGAWVSVVPVGTPESTHSGKWMYTNQTAVGKFEAGQLSPGEYEARFYGDSGYSRLMERLRFRVE